MSDGAGTRVYRAEVGNPIVVAAWLRLTAQGALLSPFDHPVWAASLAEVAGLAPTLRVLVATDSLDRILGLLPLEWSRAGRGPTVVTAPGGRWLAADAVDVIALPEHREAVAAAVTAHLSVTRDWDLIDLDSLRPDGALAAALWQLGPAMLLPAESVRSPYVDLSAGRDGLPWSRNLRQQVGRGLRAAASAGGGLEVATDPARVVALLDVLMALHVERFGDTSAVFATPERQQFHRNVAHRLAGEGAARIYRLEGGHPIGDAALLYAFRLGNRLFYYAMGMAPQVNGSPGRTVLGAAILAAADEGLSEFDLLRGSHDFKLRFSSGIRANVSVRLLRPSIGGLAFVARRIPRRARNLVRRRGS